ncbi:hypothetical protein SprV_0301180800 [Sparganum proliferum]
MSARYNRNVKATLKNNKWSVAEFQVHKSMSVLLKKEMLKMPSVFMVQFSVCPQCQRTFRSPIGLTGHLRTNCIIWTTPSDVLPPTSASPPTPTVNTDRTSEHPLPSSFIVSTFAATAPAHTATALNPNVPTNINLTTDNANDVDSVRICPHCGRTFTSRTSLVARLRIHYTETGEPVPGAPTYTRRIRLNCPQRIRTFTHRIHENLR